MAKVSARELLFEAGRAVPVYPPVAAGCALVTAAGAVAASGKVGGNTASLAGAGFLGIAVAVVGYKMLTGKHAGEAAKKLGRNLAAFLLVILAGFIVPAVLREWHLERWAWMVVAASCGLWALGSLHWFVADVMPRDDPGAGQRTRGEAYAQRHKNFASRLDVWEIASVSAVRRFAAVHRPSLQDMSAWKLWRLSRRSWNEIGMHVVSFSFGFRWVPWQRLFATYEQFTLIFGGPRTGKTLLLAWVLYWAPGFAVTTSTRSDLAEWGHEKRSHAQGWRRPPRTAVGRAWWRILNRVEVTGTRPVEVWNPNPEVKVQSSVKGSILVGCDDYETASRRAVDLIPDNTSGKADHEMWDGYARSLMGVMLYAARVTNRQVRDVLEWLGDQPLKDETSCAARREIESAIMLNPDPDQRRILAATLAEHYSRPPNTRGSVTFTATKALDWLAIPKARELGDCRISESTLDIPALIKANGTLHIIGAESNPALAPLNRVLVGEVYHQLKSLAGEMPQERLDPPAVAALDEAGNVARVPLHKWTAAMGGNSICVFASFQSEAQMIRAMGEGPAAETKGNAGNTIQFGGSNDEQGLERAAQMSGQARFKNLGEEQAAADSHTTKLAMSAADIRAMGTGQVYMIPKGLRTVRGKSASIRDVPGARRVVVEPVTSAVELGEVRVLEKAPSRARQLVAQIRRQPVAPVAMEPVKVESERVEQQVEEVSS